MRLLLIRHGQTPSNIEHLLDTAVPGAALTPLGEQQAAALPEALAGERIGALYASTLIRTQLTAAPLAARTGLEVRVRDGIRELAAGDLEMRGDAEAIETYMRIVFAWAAGDVELRMPGGENGVEALGRLDAVIEEAACSGMQTVAMVSHGAAIRVWAGARAGNIDADFAATHALDNTGVVILEGSPADGWRVRTWAGRPLGPEDDTPRTGGPTGEPLEGGVEGG